MSGDELPSATDQQALDELRATRGPYEMLEMLTRLPRARDRSVIECLCRDGDRATNSDLRDLRRRQAAGLARVHEAIDGLTRVNSLESLVQLYAEHNEMFSAAFWPMARAFASDAHAAGNMARHDDIERACGVREEVLVRIARVNEIIQGNIPAELGADLTDPAFHTFLGVLHSALVGSDAEMAASVGRVREYLVTRSRRQAEVQAARLAKPGQDGRIRVAFEVGRGNQNWHHLHAELHPAFDSIAEQVAEQKCGLVDGVQCALELVAATTPDARAYWTAYFLERVLPAIPDCRVAEVLFQYRQLEQIPGSGVLERATVILRYGFALTLNWRRLTEPRELLSEAATLLREATERVPVERVRLLRDLHLTSARLYESLASWDIDALEQAAGGYQAGLRVEGAAHDREDIGRAQGGLASVLDRLSRRRPIAPEYIEGLYEHALTRLGPDAPWNRAVVLANYAGFLMDRATEDRSASVERALMLVDEALSIAETTAPLSWTTDVHAGMHMTRANALRERKHGNVKDRLLEARSALIRGNRLATDGAEVGGLLRLNQAFVCEDLAALEPPCGYADEAALCFEAAAAVLCGNPLLAAVTEFDASMAAEDMIAARVRAKQALERLVEIGATREITIRAFRLGLSFATGATADIAEARRLFELSRVSAAALSDDEAVIRAVRSLVDLEITSSVVEQKDEALARAEILLTEAEVRAEGHWRKERTIEGRLDAHLVSLVHAELAWVKARRGGPLDEVLRHASLAKNREYLEHTRATARNAAPGAKLAVARARQAEMIRWKAQREAAPTESVYSTQSDTRDEIEDARMSEALLLGRVEQVDATYVRERLAAFFATHPTAVVEDFTVTRWGTVVVRATPDGFRALCAPLTRSELAVAVDGESGWSAKHQAWLGASEIARAFARREWASAADEVLALLQTRLFGPLADALGDRADVADLVFVPGVLAGLPLHATPGPGGVAILNAVRSVAFAPNLARLPAEAAIWRAPTSVGCVLCDPAVEGHPRLTASPAEISQLVKKFAGEGAAVMVSAGVGSETGEAALGLSAPEGVDVRSESPNAAVVGDILSRCDLFLYSGHAFRDGLLLLSEDGQPEVMSIDDVLSMAELSRRPLIHFSACSTAAEGFQAVDMFSVASCVLRIGARAVVGGLWELGDETAARFSDALYKRAADGALLQQLVTDAIKEISDEDLLSWAPFLLLLGP